MGLQTPSSAQYLWTAESSPCHVLLVLTAAKNNIYCTVGRPTWQKSLETKNHQISPRPRPEDFETWANVRSFGNAWEVAFGWNANQQATGFQQKRVEISKKQNHPKSSFAAWKFHFVTDGSFEVYITFKAENVHQEPRGKGQPRGRSRSGIAPTFFCEKKGWIWGPKGQLFGFLIKMVLFHNFWKIKTWYFLGLGERSKLGCLNTKGTNGMVSWKFAKQKCSFSKVVNDLWPLLVFMEEWELGALEVGGGRSWQKGMVPI